MDVTSVNLHENVPQYEEVGVPTVIITIHSYFDQSYVHGGNLHFKNCLGGIPEQEPQEAQDSVSDVQP